MKKGKSLRYALAIILLFPSNIYASCSNEERLEFNNIKDDFQVTYEYNNDLNNYAVTFVNPKPDSYEFVFKYDNREWTIISRDDENTTIHEIEPGNYKAWIQGKTDTCDSKLKIMDINLPRHNPYYGDSLCDGIEEFVLCQETYDKEISRELFESRVAAYKNSKLEAAKTDKNTSVIDRITRYAMDNMYEAIIYATVSVFAIVIIIYSIIRLVRKSRRFK